MVMECLNQEEKVATLEEESEFDPKMIREKYKAVVEEYERSDR